MARKLTPKQEKFCQLYIENGGNASAAYRGSYSAGKMKDETIWVNSCNLLKNNKVAIRVDELRADIAKRHEVTVDSILAELEEARQLALGDEKGASAAVAASMGKARLCGLIVEKKQIDGNIQHNHKQEPISTSLEWIAGIVGREKTIEASEPVPH